MLATELDTEELIGFFVENYRPTLIVSPWNNSSGFGKEGADGFSVIEVDPIRETRYSGEGDDAGLRIGISPAFDRSRLARLDDVAMLAGGLLDMERLADYLGACLLLDWSRPVKTIGGESVATKMKAPGRRSSAVSACFRKLRGCPCWRVTVATLSWMLPLTDCELQDAGP